jgi:hypothetical protein
MKRLLITLCLTPLVLALLMTAAQARPEIRIEPRQPLPGEPFSLSIVGNRKDSCVPELTGSELKSGSIVIRAQRTTKGCLKAETNYEINLDPMALDADGVLESGVYEVKFFVSDDAEPLARLKAFDLLYIGEPQAAIQPEQGLWWAESGGLYETSGPGTGFSIEVQDGRLVMMSNAYDLEGGPSWLFSSGILSGNLVKASLLSLHGGQSLFGSYSPPETMLESGQVLIRFHGPATATAYFVAQRDETEDADLLLHPVSLVRYAFGRGNREDFLAGEWMVIIEQDDQTSSSVRYDFQAGSERLNGGLMLTDRVSGSLMSCQGNPAKSSSPPTSCRLSGSEQGIDIAFDEIGLDRLYGWTDSGQRVTAIRWQR